MNKILFVGSNPSNSSVCDQAFHGSTRSSKILTSWCKRLTGAFIHVNVVNKKTENNRPLKKSEITSALNELASNIRCFQPTHIIALGKTASTALTLLGVDFFEMPHPSGLNRKLNDKTYMENRLNQLEQYCSQDKFQVGMKTPSTVTTQVSL